jgi:hypothetical protein
VFHEASLPGEMGTISFPANFTVELEDTKTLLAYSPHDDSISLRVSSISISRKDENDESAGKISIQDRATEKGVQYHEIEDKSYFSFEETSREDGVPLLIKYWQIGCKNTIVILSATIVAKYINNKTVQATLAIIPTIIESLKINKIYHVIETEDGQVESIITTAEPTPQKIVPFGVADNSWLQQSLELAAEINLKYGNAGSLTPKELDVIFTRWMHEEEGKESGDSIANALGAAFGEYLVDQHGFRWVVITDEYGTEYAVKTDIGETTSFPRASVQKRIEDQCTEFFQNIYYLILDRLKNAENEER